MADFATEAEACRSVTPSEWTPNTDALRFHRAGTAEHFEATEPDGLMILCRYAADGGALLKLQVLELSTTAEPSARFIEAAEHLLALFAPDAVAWFEREVSTRAKWPDGVMGRNREMHAQVVTLRNVTGSWELSITRDVDYELQPEPEPPPTRTTTETTSTAATATRGSTGLLEVPDPNCTTIMGRTQQDVQAAQNFCSLLPSGMIEGAGADGVMLNLWIDQALATDMLVNELETKQIVFDLMKSWKVLSESTSVVVQLFWKDVRVAKGKTTIMRGDVVTVGE